jgi:hypothetical protein
VPMATDIQMTADTTTVVATTPALPPKAPINSIAIGGRVEVKDSGKWWPATIVSVRVSGNVDVVWDVDGSESIDVNLRKVRLIGVENEGHKSASKAQPLVKDILFPALDRTPTLENTYTQKAPDAPMATDIQMTADTLRTSTAAIQKEKEPLNTTTVVAMTPALPPEAPKNSIAIGGRVEIKYSGKWWPATIVSVRVSGNVDVVWDVDGSESIDVNLRKVRLIGVENEGHKSASKAQPLVNDILFPTLDRTPTLENTYTQKAPDVPMATDILMTADTTTVVATSLALPPEPPKNSIAIGGRVEVKDSGKWWPATIIFVRMSGNVDVVYDVDGSESIDVNLKKVRLIGVENEGEKVGQKVRKIVHTFTSVRFLLTTYYGAEKSEEAGPIFPNR